MTHERSPTFEQIVEQHQPDVARLVRRLLGWSGASDVEDVVQDVFLAVLKGLGGFRGRSSVATWVTRITINACRSHRRRRLVRAALWERWLRRTPEASYDPPPSAGESDETRRSVRQAVARLPGRYREVVVLRYLQGMNVDEIGDVLGLTRGAIEVRLHRAREMLRGDLGALAEDR